MIAVIRKSRAPRAAGTGGARVSRAKVLAAAPKEMSSRFVMQFDGGSRGNPGPGGAGAVIYAQRGGANSSKYDEIWCGYWYLGTGVTNNYAEYSALIEGLRQGALLGLTNLTVQGDSELIIRQMQGLYQVRNVKLKPLHNEAKDIMTRFKEPPLLQHIPRSLNGRADYLSNHAMDSKASKAISAAAAVVAANKAVAAAAAAAAPTVVAATRKRKSTAVAADECAVTPESAHVIAAAAAVSEVAVPEAITSTAAVAAGSGFDSTAGQGGNVAVADASSLPASASTIVEKEKEKKEKKKKDKNTSLSNADVTTAATTTTTATTATVTVTTTTTSTAAAATTTAESESAEIEKKKKKVAASTTISKPVVESAPKD